MQQKLRIIALWPDEAAGISDILKLGVKKSLRGFHIFQWIRSMVYLRLADVPTIKKSLKNTSQVILCMERLKSITVSPHPLQPRIFNMFAPCWEAEYGHVLALGGRSRNVISHQSGVEGLIHHLYLVEYNPDSWGNLAERAAPGHVSLLTSLRP